MALNPKLVSLAGDPAVQSVARQVFGWLSERRGATPAPPQSDPQLHATLRELPTRAELATALAQIDVRIGQAERRLVRTMLASVGLATLVIGALVVLT